MVLVSQLALQAAAQAALCCQPAPGAARAAAAAPADCCPAGSHPGQLCPVHAGRRVTVPKDDACRMVCTRDVDHSMLQSIAGPLPSAAFLTPDEPAAPHADSVHARPASFPSEPVSPPPRLPSL
jgi:hypothetical protein